MAKFTNDVTAVDQTEKALDDFLSTPFTVDIGTIGDLTYLNIETYIKAAKQASNLQTTLRQLNRVQEREGRRSY